MKLDLLANAVFTQLELASGVSAKAMGEYTTHGKAAGNSPPRSGNTANAFRRRYAGCREDAQRRQVIREALDELRALRYSQHMPVMSTKEVRLMIGGDPRPKKVVMYVWRISKTHYYRCRQEHEDAVRAGILSAGHR